MSTSKVQAKGGKKGRKHGRMKRKPAYQRYLLEHRREKNAAHKIYKYIKKFSNWTPINLNTVVEMYLKKLLKNGNA